MSRLAAIRVPSRFGVVLGLLAAAGALIADTVLVPRVELRELEDGRYSLEAELSRLVVGRIQEAVLPARCAPVSDAVLRPDGPIFRWRLDFACSERLDRSDEIYLPWMVDGVQMTARWADGDVQRGLFGREGPGVRLPLDLLKLRSTSIGALVGRYLVPGALHVFKVWPHLLLILLLGLALPAARLIPVLAGITGGHALALVLAESGVVGVPTAPAEATVALAALVLAAAVIRGATIGREAVVIGGIVGIVHGLGLATELAGSALLGDRFVPALFLTSLGVDLVTWGLGIGLALVWSAVGNPGRQLGPGPAWGFGVAAAFLMLATVGAAVAPVRLAVAARELPTGAPAASARAGMTGIPNQLTSTGELAWPFLSYLTIEPYQVRHEVLASVAALGEWLEIPGGEEGTISIAEQEALAAAAASLLAADTELRIDGEVGVVAEGTASFVTVGQTGVLTRGQPVPESAAEGVLGITLVYETDGLADDVSLGWRLFGDAVRAVPVTVTDPAASVESVVTIEAPDLEWRNTLGEYTLPTVDAIRAERPALPLVSLGLVLFAVTLLLLARRRPSEATTRLAGVAPILLLAAYLSYPFVRVSAEIPLLSEPRLQKEQAGEVLEGLLVNVYRSFDIHDEEAIYDRLSLTVTGEQLLDVYLESRRALELENRGGARVRIDEVVVREVRSVDRTDEGGYLVDVLWTVGGSVSHFGHQHFRLNRYDALLTIVPSEGTWKIRTIALVEEKRLM